MSCVIVAGLIRAQPVEPVSYLIAVIVVFTRLSATTVGAAASPPWVQSAATSKSWMTLRTGTPIVASEATLGGATPIATSVPITFTFRMRDESPMYIQGSGL